MDSISLYKYIAECFSSIFTSVLAPYPLILILHPNDVLMQELLRD